MIIFFLHCFPGRIWGPHYIIGVWSAHITVWCPYNLSGGAAPCFTLLGCHSCCLFPGNPAPSPSSSHASRPSPCSAASRGPNKNSKLYEGKQTEQEVTLYVNFALFVFLFFLLLFLLFACIHIFSNVIANYVNKAGNITELYYFLMLC